MKAQWKGFGAEFVIFGVLRCRTGAVQRIWVTYLQRQRDHGRGRGCIFGAKAPIRSGLRQLFALRRRGAGRCGAWLQYREEETWWTERWMKRCNWNSLSRFREGHRLGCAS